MENLIKYKPIVLAVFNDYIQSRLSKSEFIINLVEIEVNIAVELNCLSSLHADKHVWFKFFKDDTLATTIADIDTDLNTNCKFITECIELAISTDGLEIYFS